MAKNENEAWIINFSIKDIEQTENLSGWCLSAS